MKKVLRVAGTIAIALIAIVAIGGWLIVRDEVAAIRAIAANAGEPLPRNVRSAIIAAEDPVILERPRFSLRAITATVFRRDALRCGPSPIAYTLVKSVSRPRRMLYWHINTMAATLVVSRMYEPEELLRIYAHDRGIEASSATYFGKRARDLTVPEAATIAGMIRSPSYYSPRNHPDRALDRRNYVLARMHRLGFIDKNEFEAATASSL